MTTPDRIQIDGPSLEAVKRLLGSAAKRAPEVLVRVVNKTTRATIAAVSKGIRQDYNVTSERIKDAFAKKSRKAKKTDLSARLVCSGRRLTLMQFQPKKYGSKRKGGASGVSYKISNAGGRKRIEGAWIGKGQAGTGAGARQGDHELVFRRIGKNVIAPMGPSVPTMMEKRLPEYEAAATDALGKNLEGEVNYVLNV